MSSTEITFEKYKSIKENAENMANDLVALEENILIITQGNPDDLCAAGTLMKCLHEIKLGSHTVILDNISTLSKRIKKLNYSSILFIGIHIDDIPSDILKEKNVYVINHQLCLKEKRKKLDENIKILSLEEIDLPEEAISNAGLTYFVASGLLDDYQKFSGLGIIGALYKKQTNPKNQELNGLNKYIMDDGKEKEHITTKKGTRIPGRESQPIHLALMYSLNPYFPGLTGNEGACTKFVSRLDIKMRDQEDNWRTISSLKPKETKALNDALIALLMKNDSQPITDIYKLIGPIYILNKEHESNQTRNVEEFLWLLEGACQMKLYGLALAVILGDRSNRYDSLQRDLSNYHGKATEIIKEIANNPDKIEDEGLYRIINGSDVFKKESAFLVMNALIESSTIPIDKPLLMYIEEKDTTILYIRESPIQIQRGHLLFHLFQELEKEKSALELKGDFESFVVKIEKENFKKTL
ncbi:MAG: hypothetical protein ACFFDS_05070, partial [Candidatus Thorarchaeota archaeon]